MKLKFRNNGRPDNEIYKNEIKLLTRRKICGVHGGVCSECGLQVVFSLPSVRTGQACLHLPSLLTVLHNHTPCNIPIQPDRIPIVFTLPLKMEVACSKQTFAKTDIATGCRSPQAHV
jgi:hypothetical protein